MATTLSVRLRAEPLRSVAAAAINPGFDGLGGAYLHPVRIYCLTNNTNGTLIFSWDGITDNLILPPFGFKLIDCTANKSIENGLFIAQGDRTYVRYSAQPTQGDVYLEILYGTSA